MVDIQYPISALYFLFSFISLFYTSTELHLYHAQVTNPTTHLLLSTLGCPKLWRYPRRDRRCYGRPWWSRHRDSLLHRLPGPKDDDCKVQHCRQACHLRHPDAWVHDRKCIATTINIVEWTTYRSLVDIFLFSFRCLEPWSITLDPPVQRCRM